MKKKTARRIITKNAWAITAGKHFPPSFWRRYRIAQLTLNHETELAQNEYKALSPTERIARMFPSHDPSQIA